MSDYQRALKALPSVPEDMPPEDEWKQFHVEDQYNPRNTLTGFLSRRSTRFYGALLISHVNNQACSQLVFCTPKLHYPFDKHGRYRFPKARQILAYDKLDGTNILCYGYTDARGRRFWTFKSRLTPVLRDSTVVSFTALLKETGRQEDLRALAKETGWNISCELWGAKNMHLIAYEKPIELSLLFAVGQMGWVLPPRSIKVQHCIPVTTFYGKVEGNYVETYNAHRVEDEQRLKPHMEGYSGSEGRVWYLLTEDMLWRQFKLKPETVEQIHWCLKGSTQIRMADGTEKPIKGIKPSDVVLAYSRPRQRFEDRVVRRVFSSNPSSLVDWLEVLLESGRKLTITSEHRVLTTEGWRKAGDLIVGDDLVGPDTLE